MHAGAMVCVGGAVAGTRDPILTRSAEPAETNLSLGRVAQTLRQARVTFKLGVCLQCGRSVQPASDARARYVFCNAEHEKLFCVTAMSRSLKCSL